MGLGVLAKGPVMLLHVLPLALLAPWWHERMPHTDARYSASAWYRGVALAVSLAAAIALAWAVPAAIAGGEALRREIFWSQSVDRIATTSHHWRPAWYYVPTLPLLLFPWLCWPATWRGIAALARRARAGGPSPPGLRFALAWSLPVLLALSLFHGKQVQYLLPEVPAFAVVLAWALASVDEARRWEAALPATLIALLAIALAVLAQHPVTATLVVSEHADKLWPGVALCLIAAVLAVSGVGHALHAVMRMAAAAVLLALGLTLGVVRALAPAYDTRPIGEQLATLQAAAIPIAHLGKYHGQYQFAGRLRQPLQVLHDAADVRQWAAQHPQGRIVAYSRVSPGSGPEFVHRFRDQYASVWRADAFAPIADDWLRRNAGSLP
jgi:4-amino-4-deoxy-L-arabinose transferase-like glycosyltransferase